MARSNKHRANKRNYNFDESKLRPGQRQAALLLVERDFADKSDRMTYQQIGDEVGFTRKTIHEWNSRDRNFIEYKNYLAADFFDAYLPMVYSKMIEGISNGSMKGIELYLKRIGDLDNRSEVTVNNGSNDNESFDERKAALLERLNESEDTDDGEGEEDDE